MGNRGKKPTRMAVVDPTTKRRPAPLRGMSEPARRVWKRVVGAYPPDHFKPQHLGMLLSYCEAEATNKKASKEIAVETVIKQDNGVTKANPWLQIYIQTASTMAQLGTKLGITKNSTTSARGETGSAAKSKSKRDGLLFGGKNR